jgi:hypothetical protein
VTNNGGYYDIGYTCTLLRGMGGGAFGARTDLIVDQRPGGAVLKDVNGDGTPDLLIIPSAFGWLRPQRVVAAIVHHLIACVNTAGDRCREQIDCPDL